MGFRRLNISGIGEAKKMLLDEVIRDFLISGSNLKERITDEGIEELLNIQWNLDMDVLPELCKMSKDQWDRYCEKRIKEFRENVDKSI